MSTMYRTTSPGTKVNRQSPYALVKRLIDVALSLIGLFFLSPLLAAIALWIKLDSPGPILFFQKRIGKGGHPFQIIKFRTMEHGLDNADHKAFMRAYVRGEIGNGDNGQNDITPHDAGSGEASKAAACVEGKGTPVFKPFQKSQVTRVGRFLRKTSLDELPQLLNILVGEMSLVGPRPNVPWEVDEYAKWHRERLQVLPGITGLAQVNGRSCLDFDTIAQYDIEYVRNRTVWLDLEILAKTVLLVLGGRGAL